MSFDPPKGPKEIDAVLLEERVLYSATPFTFFASDGWFDNGVPSCEIPFGFDYESWPIVLADLEQFASLHGFSSENANEFPTDERILSPSESEHVSIPIAQPVVAPNAFHSSNETYEMFLDLGNVPSRSNSSSEPNGYAIRSFSDTLDSASIPIGESVSFTNLIRDAHFDHASTPPLLPGYSIFPAGHRMGEWQVESGLVDLNGDHYLQSPSGGRTIDLNGDSGTGSIVQFIETVPGQRYQVTFAATGNWVQSANINGLEVSAGETSETFAIRRSMNHNPLDRAWEIRTFTFEATSAESKLRFSAISPEIRPAIIGDLHMIALPDTIAETLEADPTLKFNATELEYFRVNPTSWRISEADSTTHWTLDTDVAVRLKCRFSSTVDAMVAKLASVPEKH